MKIKIQIALLTLLLTGRSKAQQTARNDDWRITPPPTVEEMSHYRIVQNETKTAYAVQSTNTCWLNEKSWFQNGNTWNNLRECTNDIHSDVGAWRKRRSPEKWAPVATIGDTKTEITNISAPSTNGPTVRWQYQRMRDEQERYKMECDAAAGFNATNTNPRVVMTVHLPNPRFEYPLTASDVELGYRSDGIVIWRTPPEAFEK